MIQEVRERALGLLWEGRPRIEVGDIIRSEHGTRLLSTELNDFARMRKAATEKRGGDPDAVDRKKLFRDAWEIANYHPALASVAMSLATRREYPFNTKQVLNLLEADKGVRGLKARLRDPWKMLESDVERHAPQHTHMLSLAKALSKYRAYGTSPRVMYKRLKKHPKGESFKSKLRNPWKNVAKDALAIASEHESIASLSRALTKRPTYAGFHPGWVHDRIARTPQYYKVKAKLDKPWRTLVDDALELAPSHETQISLAEALLDKERYAGHDAGWLLIRLRRDPRWKEVDSKLARKPPIDWKAIVAHAERLAPSHTSIRRLARGVEAEGKYGVSPNTIYEVIKNHRKRRSIENSLRDQWAGLAGHALEIAGRHSGLRSIARALHQRPEYSELGVSTIEAHLRSHRQRKRIEGAMRDPWKDFIEDAKRIAPMHDSLLDVTGVLATRKPYSEFKADSVYDKLLLHPKRDEVEAVLARVEPDWSRLEKDAMRLAPRHESLQALAKALAQTKAYKGMKWGRLADRLYAHSRREAIEDALRDPWAGLFDEAAAVAHKHRTFSSLADELVSKGRFKGRFGEWVTRKLTGHERAGELKALLAGPSEKMMREALRVAKSRSSLKSVARALRGKFRRFNENAIYLRLRRHKDYARLKGSLGRE
jgi:truncated hemoglobin YjbI